MATSTALATAFYRLYILHALADHPARPAAVLAALHAREGALPLPTGCFTRALQQLLDSGLVVAGPGGALQLTPTGERERGAQRAAWERLVGLVTRLLAGDIPAPEPPSGGGMPLPVSRDDPTAAGYRERVVVAEVREAMRRARDYGSPFAIVVGDVAVAHAEPARARAMLHRALRETLGGARAIFGAEAIGLRYGAHGVALLVPARDAEAQAELLRARLAESLAAMIATVRAFAGARYCVRVGAARWTPEVATSAQLLRRAEAELERIESRSSAA